MRIERVAAYRIAVPLKRAYAVSFSTVSTLDSIVVEIADERERSGWGEVTVIPGYTPETPDSAWEFARAAVEHLAGKTNADAKRFMIGALLKTPHAAGPFLMALDMLEDAPVFSHAEPIILPLLAPVLDHDPQTLQRDVEQLLALGHRTLKAKVGFDVKRDLRRVAAIGKAIRGLAKLRVDANQGFSCDHAIRFAAALDPEFVELFEQPCNARDWDANVTVAAVSPVPIMLDESVYGFDDIQRAATIPGVAYAKIELVKWGSATLMRDGLQLIRDCGLRPIAGNGAATDISSWMEACASHGIVEGASEMHGFLKLSSPLFEPPLQFDRGTLTIPAGFRPTIDRAALERFTTARHAAAPSLAARAR